MQDLIGRYEIRRELGRALRDALSATEGTGTLTCDENGDCADPKIAVSQVYRDEYVAVWPQSGE